MQGDKSCNGLFVSALQKFHEMFSKPMALFLLFLRHSFLVSLCRFNHGLLHLSFFVFFETSIPAPLWIAIVIYSFLLLWFLPPALYPFTISDCGAFCASADCSLSMMDVSVCVVSLFILLLMDSISSLSYFILFSVISICFYLRHLGHIFLDLLMYFFQFF